MFKKLVDKFIKEKDKVDYIDISKQRTKVLNQKAIECLEDVKEHFNDYNNLLMGLIRRADFIEYIDQKISELKGE